ncbi:MAG: fibronectin type III domain-containing protein, partial [Bacteroidetes bacterium]
MRKIYQKFLLAAAMLLPAMTMMGQQVSIGTGTAATQSTATTATSLQSPWNTFYAFSYVQTIYLQSEINASGNITSISYFFTGTSMSANDQIVVRMGTVSRSSFASNTDWEPVANLTTVFDGTITPTVPGWVTITLSTPFPYNNVGNLLIAIDENRAGDNGTASFRTTTPSGSTNRTIFFRSDGTNPDPTGTLPTANGRSNVIGNIQINGLVLSNCQIPTAVSIGSVATTSATATFSAPATGSTPSQYNWEVRTSGNAGSGATGLVASGNSSTTSVSLTSLTPGTNYMFYVRSDCGGGVTSPWTAAAAFTTQCLATAIPWTENFDALATGTNIFPNCWGFANKTSSWSIVTTQALSAPNSLYRSWTTDGWAFTPLFNLTAGTSYTFSYFVRTSTATVGYNIDVAVANTQDSVAMVSNILSSVAGYQGVSWVERTVTFVPPTSGNYSFGMRVTAPSAPSGIFFDNFSVRVTPTCIQPTNVVYSNILPNSTTVAWTAPATGNTPASYELFVSTSNTEPTGSTTPTTTGITGTTTSLTNLTSATTYFVWVRSNCGSGDVSAWTLRSSFVTACDAVTSFTQNFDAVTTPALPACFAKVGTTGSLSTQSTSSLSSPNCLYIYAISPADKPYLTLPPVSNINAGTHRLRYRMRANFTVGGVLQTGYMTNPMDTTTFVSLQNSTTTSTTVYDAVQVNYPSTVPAGATLAIRHTGVPANSILIDDMVWEAIPSCIEPSAVVVSNITTTGATVAWTAPTTGNTPASYELFVSTSATAPTANTVPTQVGVSGVTTTLTGLPSATTHYVWVRTNCGGSISSWTSPAVVFSTACNPTTGLDSAAYVQNFDGVVAPAIPPCITVQNVNGNSTWATSSSVTSLIGGVNSMRYLYDLTSDADDWFFTAPLTLEAGTSYSLRFKGLAAPTTFEERLEVKFGQGANAAAMTSAAIYSNTNILGSVNVNVSFTPTTTGVYHIGFRCFSLFNKNYLSIDSIQVSTTRLLPVSITSFTGAKKATVNELSWVTANEVNNAGFTLQRSVDGRNFTKIGFVAT